MPEVTGEPAAVTLTVAVAAENCVMVAAGEKLTVVDVSAGGPANTAVVARSASAAVALTVENRFFIVENPSELTLFFTNICHLRLSMDVANRWVPLQGTTSTFCDFAE